MSPAPVTGGGGDWWSPRTWFEQLHHISPLLHPQELADAGGVDSLVKRPDQPQRSLQQSPVFVFVNPTARAGKVAKQIGKIGENLSAAKVDHKIFSERIADITTRKTALQQSFAAYQDAHPGKKMIVVAVGGDGTLDFVVNAITEKITGKPIETIIDPDEVKSVNALLNEKVAFVFTKHGTASDLAYMVGASSDPKKIPMLAETGLVVGRLQPIVDGKPALHSVGYGLVGEAFKIVEEAMKANGGKKSLGSYFAPVPMLTAKYILSGGFDVEVKIDGELYRNNKGQSRFPAALVLGTPSRIVAGVAGSPGAFDHFKFFIVQPNWKGFTGFSEGLIRGLGTKFFGRSSWLEAGSKFFHMPGYMDITVKLGQNATLAFYQRSDLNWFQRYFSKKFGVISGESTREPIQVHSINNGDYIGERSQVKIEIPKVKIPVLAAPDSLAVRLHRSTALAEGYDPHISDAAMVQSRFGENGLPQEKVTSKGEVRWAQSPYVSQSRLYQLAKSFGLGNAHLKYSYLLMDDLVFANNGDSKNIRIEDIRNKLAARPETAFKEPFNKALWGLNFPLVGLVASLPAGEFVKRYLGVSPSKNQALFFTASVYTASAAQYAADQLMNIYRHSIMRKPYAFVTEEVVKISSEPFVRYTYHASKGFILLDWSAALYYGLRNGMGKVPKAIAGVIASPLRAAIQMGDGLIWSRGVEFLFEKALAAKLGTITLPGEARLKTAVATGALFLPQMVQTVAPSGTFSNFMASKYMRKLGRFTGLALVADLGIATLLIKNHSEQEMFFMQDGARRAEVAGARDWLSNGIHFFAPSIGTYWDTHDIRGNENEYMQKSREDYEAVVSQTKQDYPKQMLALAEKLEKPATEVWTGDFNLNNLETRVQDFVMARVTENPTLQETQLVALVQNNFAATGLRKSQIGTILARIQVDGMQKNMQALNINPSELL